MVTILHAVDIETLHVIATVVSLFDELGYQRVVHQPQAATPLAKAAEMHRDATPKRGNSPKRNADAVEALPSTGLCSEHHWVLLPERRALRGT